MVTSRRVGCAPPRFGWSLGDARGSGRLGNPPLRPSTPLTFRLRGSGSLSVPVPVPPLPFGPIGTGSEDGGGGGGRAGDRLVHLRPLAPGRGGALSSPGVRRWEEEGGPARALRAGRAASLVLLSAGSARVPQRKVGEALTPEVFSLTSASVSCLRTWLEDLCGAERPSGWRRA